MKIYQNAYSKKYIYESFLAETTKVHSIQCRNNLCSDGHYYGYRLFLHLMEWT